MRFLCTHTKFVFKQITFTIYFKIIVETIWKKFRSTNWRVSLLTNKICSIVKLNNLQIASRYFFVLIFVSPPHLSTIHSFLPPLLSRNYFFDTNITTLFNFHPLLTWGQYCIKLNNLSISRDFFALVQVKHFTTILLSVAIIFTTHFVQKHPRKKFRSTNRRALLTEKDIKLNDSRYEYYREISLYSHEICIAPHLNRLFVSTLSKCRDYFYDTNITSLSDFYLSFDYRYPKSSKLKNWKNLRYKYHCEISLYKIFIALYLSKLFTRFHSL